MLYLVRHGQTAFNLAKRYQGALDSPLTSLGEAQAAAIGRCLATRVDKATPIVTSPLGRAVRTAEILREAGAFSAPIATEPRIAEITLGAWDGLTEEDIEALYPGARAGTSRHDWHFSAPGGESHDAFAGRLAAWLEEALAGPLPLIVISHGLSGRMLRGLYSRLSTEETMKLTSPQDAYYCLTEGRTERIECELEFEAPGG